MAGDVGDVGQVGEVDQAVDVVDLAVLEAQRVDQLPRSFGFIPAAISSRTTSPKRRRRISS